ncbi:hypothetical protein G6M50_26450 [Agrobacterium rhizogenes]|nr:hypothetical protein [Rhizobium rhizogenes]NTJ81331.1 hypothetical protein [Rhizobium rhizogenes]
MKIYASQPDLRRATAHKNSGSQNAASGDDKMSGNNQTSGTRGGSHEQPVKAGQQSHRNS